MHEALADCYSAELGRPSVDPELALRMLILAEFYDLPIRELCRELAVHTGWRWFCRFAEAKAEHCLQRTRVVVQLWAPLDSLFRAASSTGCF